MTLIFYTDNYDILTTMTLRPIKIAIEKIKITIK